MRSQNVKLERETGHNGPSVAIKQCQSEMQTISHWMDSLMSRVLEQHSNFMNQLKVWLENCYY